MKTEADYIKRPKEVVSVVVRMPPSLKKYATATAKRYKTSLNRLTIAALSSYLAKLK